MIQLLNFTIELLSASLLIKYHKSQAYIFLFYELYISVLIGHKYCCVSAFRYKRDSEKKTGDTCLSRHHGDPIKNPFEHHSAMALRDLRKDLKRAFMMPGDVYLFVYL